MVKDNTNDGRVNTTFIGYIIIGFILLLVGMFGLQTGNLFGENVLDWPTSIQVVSRISFAAGVILLLLTIFAYRTGERTTAGIFAISGFTMIILETSSITGVIANSNWFVYIGVAVMYLVLMLYTILGREPKMISLLLLVVAIMFVFAALSCFFDSIIPGPGNDEGLFHLMGILYAIFAFIGFFMATYLGLAFSHPKRIPVF